MSPKPPSTRRMIKAFLRPWWRRPLALVAGVALALVVGRIALDPWLTARVRSHLARLDTAGVVTFRDLEVSLFPPSAGFKDVAFRGKSGESLDIDRLDVHLASLRDLWAAVPHVRMKVMRPNLRTTPGARDLDQLARALPTVRVDVASVEHGSISNFTGGDGRPVMDGVSGAVEGLATGAQMGRGGWRISAEGHLADLNPTRVAIIFAPAGTWEMALTARAVAWARGPDGLPIEFAAHVAGASSRLEARVRVSWTGTMVPVMLARDTLSGLSDKWPTTDLVLTEAREAPGSAGQALDLVMTEGSVKAVAGRFHPLDGIGVVVNVIRLGTEVLIPPPPGLAAVVKENPARPGTKLAVNLEKNHGTN